ncbi:MAG: DedA family protein [Gammaproteobacteria bacterium]|nr:DedA family protein [Gammaproteobacteria bacterium]
MENLLADYGYLAILIGTFLEGETVLVLGAVAAQLGYLELAGVMAAGFTGTVAGDQLYFFLGRRHGQSALRRYPRWQGRADRVFSLLQRYGAWVIVGYRFLYGLRTVAAFVIGTSPIGTAKFIVFSLAGALVWTLTVASAGYLFGQAIELVIGDIKRYELALLGTIAAIATLVWLIYLYRGWRQR